MSKTAIMFPGVGTQYEHMGKRLLEHISAKQIFEQAGEILKFDLEKFMSEEEINWQRSPEIIQPLLVTYGFAVYTVLKDSCDIQIFLGHSLGEITALLCAGYIGFESAIRFSVKRGRVYDASRGHGETAIVIGIEEQALTEAIRSVSETGPVYITGYNTRSQFLVAGCCEGLKAVGNVLKNTPAMFVPYSMLPMRDNIPIHCELMKCGQDVPLCFEDDITVTDSVVISSVSGKRCMDESEIRKNLSRQMYSPVLWKQAVHSLVQEAPQTIIDSGPQQVLKEFFMEEYQEMKGKIFAADVKSDLKKLKERGGC